MKISIAIPSYKRPKVKTLEYIPDARVYICESEYDEYKDANKKIELVSMPKGVQGNIARVRNYIIKQELTENDSVCIVDDDMDFIGYFENKKLVKFKTDEIRPFLEKYTLLCQDFGFYMWGLNVNTDKQCYREYTPFSTLSFVGAPFTVTLKGNNCWYDERIPLKEDYDMTIQQINKNRGILRLNKFCYQVKQSKQTGGCALYRNIEREEQQLRELQKKWGKRIVKVDMNDRSHRNVQKKNTDYNPIIKVPIRGV
jgi:hypothetical protein